VAGKTGEGAALASVRLVGVGSATVLADKNGEGAGLASVRTVGVGSASHCVGRHDRRGRSSGLSSLGRRGLSQQLCWRSRHVKAMHWLLFSWSSWVQAGTVLAGTTGEGIALASVRSVGVGSASHCCGGHDR
jgi:hypothetical protein